MQGMLDEPNPLNSGICAENVTCLFSVSIAITDFFKLYVFENTKNDKNFHELSERLNINLQRGTISW